MFDKIAIFGVGLIGGSLARALREASAVDEIVGYGRGLSNLEQAVELGVIDRAVVSVEDAMAGTDVAILATSVGSIPRLLEQIAARLQKPTIITDVGSVKAAIVRSARHILGKHFPSFVGGHPIAGTERAGVAASFADLFRDHRVVLTPEAETDAGAVERIRMMWELTGAEVVQMEAEEHDEIFAQCSHLPHLLAYTLVDMLVRQDNHRALFEFSAGGFRDFTRIASSDPTMWRDVCIANSGAIAQALEQYRDNLSELLKAVETHDSKALLATFQRAKLARDSYIKEKNGNYAEAD